MRISYMPTNRACVPAIRDGVHECRVLQDEVSQEYVFVLIEQGEDEYEENADALYRFASEYDIQCIHLTRTRWELMISAILNATSFSGPDADRIRELLSPPAVAYGAGPNKAFVMAAALGVDVLHRRDSDQVADERSGGKAFPGVLEARAIGRPVGYAVPLLNGDDYPSSVGNSPVYFVGSTTFGDPAHDRRDLFSAGEEYMLALEQLESQGVWADRLRAKVHSKFVMVPVTRHDSDFYRICDGSLTDIGVSCIYRIFLELPEMPIVGTLGSDYFQKSLLYQLGRPVLFQSRKMQHSYDGTRAAGSDLQGVADYAKRDLRRLILVRARSALNTDVRTRRHTYLGPDGSLDAARYADGLIRAADAELPDARRIPAAFSTIYAEAANSATGSLEMRLRAVAEAVRESEADFVADVRRGILDYVWLIRRWKRLIAAAPTAARTLKGYLSSP